MLITSADFKALAAIERMIGRRIEELSRFSVEMDPPPASKGEQRGKFRKKMSSASSIQKEKKQRRKKEIGGTDKSRPMKEPFREKKRQKVTDVSISVEKESAFGKAVPAFMTNEVKLS